MKRKAPTTSVAFDGGSPATTLPDAMLKSVVAIGVIDDARTQPALAAGDGITIGEEVTVGFGITLGDALIVGFGDTTGDDEGAGMMMIGGVWVCVGVTIGVGLDAGVRGLSSSLISDVDLENPDLLLPAI